MFRYTNHNTYASHYFYKQHARYIIINLLANQKRNLQLQYSNVRTWGTTQQHPVKPDWLRIVISADPTCIRHPR